VAQSTALVAAAGCRQLDAVRLLLDRGADPSLPDSAGDTPLMQAAGGGHAGVVRELVARGADLDAADQTTGATAFHNACGFNQPDCVAALVELGCDTTIKATSGQTGKQMAESQGGGAGAAGAGDDRRGQVCHYVPISTERAQRCIRS
jgi:ankyrin repeat protein